MAKVNFRHSLPALALVATLLSACSASPTGRSTPHRSASSGAFPIKLDAANGVVTIAHRPDRIVSLSPTVTEDLYAIGAGSQVVAVDSYSTYPPNAPRTALSGYSPNVEAIAKYGPDLVVVSEDPNNVISQLGTLGIPVLYEPAASNLGAAYAEIVQLARATGHAVAASQLVSRMRHEITALVRSVPQTRRLLRVYHELEPTLYSATSQTFIGQIYKMFGLIDIADKAHAAGPYPQLSAEYIIASNPNLIVLADTECCGQSPATVAARPGWSGIAAVKDGGVVPVGDAIASRWGPRIVLFVKAVTNAIARVQKASR